MKKILLIIIVISLFCSCSSFVYYPSAANAPLFKEKQEMKVSLGLKGYSAYVSSAYALSDNFAIQANGHVLRIKNTELGNELVNRNFYGEAALGFYFPFVDKFVAEFYFGTGNGFTGYDNITSTTIKNNYHVKAFIQGDIGYTTPFFDAGLILKGSYVLVYKELIDGVENNNPQQDIFYEPLLFLKFGSEQHKVAIEGGLAFSHVQAMSYAPLILTLGYEYNFKLK